MNNTNLLRAADDTYLLGAADGIDPIGSEDDTDLLGAEDDAYLFADRKKNLQNKGSILNVPFAAAYGFIPCPYYRGGGDTGQLEINVAVT